MNEIYQSGLSGDRVMELLRRQFVVPTLSSAPTTNTLRWVDDMGYTNTFRVGELCRVAIDDGYTFYILKDLRDGVATWELMGSGGGEGDTDLAPVYNLIKTKLDNSYFRRIFSPLDANGNEIAPNDVNTPISSIRVNYGLWSESFLSAKGRNSEGTSSGGGAVALYQLNDVAKNSSANGVLGAAKGSLLSYDGTHWYAIPQSSVMPNLSGYATQSWVEDKGYATQLWVEGKGYSTKSELNTAISAVNATIDEVITEVEGKLDASVFDELFEKVTLEDGKTQAIRAKLGLYTDSFLSAKGANGNGTSSGSAAALYQLNDVLADGNKVQGASVGSLLAYNGSHWYAIAQSSITPDLSVYAKKTDIPTIPTKVSAFENDANYATTSDLDNRIDSLVNGAPAAYDTLKEIADVLAGNVNSISDILTALGNKADKATTLSGYGITDAYTIAQIDSIVNGLSGNISTLQGYFTEGVANSAKKLANARSIWGRSFDGTADIDEVPQFPNEILMNRNPNSGAIINTSYLGFGVQTYDSYIAFKMYNPNGTSVPNAITINASGNVGVGNTSPQYKLDVNGTTRTTKLVIGNGSIEWDETNKGFKIVGGLYTESYLSAKGANTNGGSSSGGGLIESLWKVGDLGKTFNTNANDTFNAYAINAIHNRVSVLEGKATNVSFTQSLTSGTQIGTITIDGASKNIYAPTIPTDDINKGVTAHGWGNHASAGYQPLITSTNKLAYSLISGTPTKLSQFTNDLGLGTFAYKSSLAFADLTNKPTTISGYGITDAYTKSQVDSALGGYLPLSGGTIEIITDEGLSVNRTNGTRALISFKVDGGYKGGLGIDTDGVPLYRTYTGGINALIHSGNIGSQSVASAAKLVATERTKVLDANALTFTDFSVRFYSNLANNCSNIPTGIAGWANAILALPIHDSGTTAQLFITRENNLLYFRQSQTDAWKGIAFLDSNVASATKLQTARSIWGQSFDGTADITHGFRSMYTGSYNGDVAHSILNYYDNPYGLITRIYNDGVVSLQSQRETTNNEYFNLSLNPLGGNVGIGTTTDNGYKLNVNGNLFAARLKLNNICFECGTDGSASGCSSEINNFTDKLYLQLHSSLDISMCHGGGNVGIGTISPQYKLDVSGVIHSTTGIFSDGYVSAKGQNTSSDMRLKNVLNDVVLNVSDIANAPSIRFAWKNGGGIDVGSSAQYWQKLLPDAVKERDGMLEMQYANIALLSAIAIAKNVETHEERIARLEKENKELRTKIDMMERGIA